jgi:hypothetical protein
VNRKKESAATFDIKDSKKGEAVRILISQVATVSWATTQIPEITPAIQSFLNTGLDRAAQLELFLMIGDQGLHTGTRAKRFMGLENLAPRHRSGALL